MFDLKTFLLNLRYNPATRIKTAIVVLCIITWGATGICAWLLLNTQGQQQAAGSENNTSAPATTNVVTAAPPVIAGLKAVEVSDSSAVFIWSTDLPATGSVEYWIEGSGEKASKESTVLESTHRLVITGLKSQTQYFFTVKSEAANGLAAASGEGNFTTGVAVVLESPEVGYLAPDFTLSTQSSENITLSSYRGKWLLLVFWETTCAACREELPDIQTYYNRMTPGKMNILTVNAMNRSEGILASFLQSRNLTLPVVLDPDGAITTTYKITQFPTLFFIDSKGIIRFVYNQRLQNTDQIADVVLSVIGN
jgi:peroxiredoxin